MSKFEKFVSTNNLDFTENEIERFEKIIKNYLKNIDYFKNAKLFMEKDTEYKSIYFSIRLDKEINLKNDNGTYVKFDGISFFITKTSGYLEKEFKNGKSIVDTEHKCPNFQYSLTINLHGKAKAKNKRIWGEACVEKPYYYGTNIEEDFKFAEFYVDRW